MWVNFDTEFDLEFDVPLIFLPLIKLMIFEYFRCLIDGFDVVHKF